MLIITAPGQGAQHLSERFEIIGQHFPRHNLCSRLFQQLDKDCARLISLLAPRATVADSEDNCAYLYVHDATSLLFVVAPTRA